MTSINSPETRALAYHDLAALQIDVLANPHKYTKKDAGLATRIAVYSYALGQGQTITNDQSYGKALEQLITRLLEETCYEH